MVKSFTRKDLESGESTVISTGRWGNADLYQFGRGKKVWVVKDFSSCAPAIKKTWGRFLVQRECMALTTLKGMPGVPADPFLLDEDAVCYKFQPGTTLKETPSEFISDDFFFQLEELVNRMHRRDMVHLDLRNRRNILVTDKGHPALLDFQSSLNLKNTPVALHKIVKDIDLSGVYKHWRKKKPVSLDSARLAHLESLNRIRFLWFLKGYPLGTKTGRRALPGF
ncbi:hypothetical protein DSLASN_16300 [Desulfoluna limicola]|uniref:Serine/threonine protein kinase n=1 Tax=Desulfoluna limicola TaxID=2810562 RepID=A0ABM7PG02_9BACT|nr:hypothetical protein [Desulfoluna limicola]BCS95998.1 hypothetical protein DSLASN_16300 [Desulfoluna limicola]